MPPLAGGISRRRPGARFLPMKPGPRPSRTGYIPGSMATLAFPFRPVLALGAALLASCVTGSGGQGRALAEGHYFISGRFDSNYVYEQFFVVQADNRYEWVEYGYNGASSQVCKVTRHAGSYGLGETSLGLVREKDAGPVEKCGFTASDFRAMKWTDRKETAALDFEVRNVGEDSFEAKDFFSSDGGFQTLARKPDPFGFYD